MNPEQFIQSLKAEAADLGFQWASTCAAVTPTGFSPLAEWVEDGYAGEMHYIPERLSAYEHPKFVMPEVKSILMLALNYNTATNHQSGPGLGKIARYAWGDGDYHDLIHKKLKQLCRHAKSICEDVRVRGVVDTAPLLEREFAQRAGIGWHAKNTMIINRDLGSWFFLAAVLIDMEVPIDHPFETQHCGTCTACLDACPTDAFVEPGKLDATRCISYLTIEHRSPIENELRPLMQDWILGCDICQDVCPWNRKSPTATDSFFEPREDLNPFSLPELFELTDDEFRARFRKTPLWRPRRRGILRNAAIALGNTPCPEAFTALTLGLDDEEPLVRGASAWALARQNNPAVEHRLEQRAVVETDSIVLKEINCSLTHLRQKNP